MKAALIHPFNLINAHSANRVTVSDQMIGFVKWSRPDSPGWRWLTGLLVLFCGTLAINAANVGQQLSPFLKQHCIDCHDAEVKKGGLDLTALDFAPDKPANLASWIRVHDRVRDGEMPPPKKPQPPETGKESFLTSLSAELTRADLTHKGTVLRRLNRLEYQNTLNDLFGTHLDLAATLPEDGRSHEFENVGGALSISMVQMQRYLDGAGMVLEAAIAGRMEKPEPSVIRASYVDSREGSEFIGKVWKQLDDGAVVFFRRLGYPSGMLRGSNVRTPGRYKIRVTGYAYQSDRPITFYLGGTSFARGSEKPTYGYFSMPTGKPTTIETEAWIESNYMLQIEPYGLVDRDNSIRKDGIANYQGPGLAILQVELEGPLVSEWPTRGHRLVFEGVERKEIPPRNPRDREKSWYVPKYQVHSADPAGDAARVLRRVASAAFRRPAGEERIQPYLALFREEQAKGADFEEALRTAITAIFCAPDFLYLRESPGRLDDYGLASRLSYFLVRTAPDERLLKLAAAGRLTRDPEALRSETERLLGDSRSERFVTDFTDAWLDLRSIEFTSPEARLYPEFDGFLQYSMLGETRSFFRELVRGNLSIANFINSEFAMINSRLAEHYGLPGVTGPEFQKIGLPAASPRGGVMAQASILKVSANGTATSPVLRGVWVLERIMGITPAPPPPSVPGLEPDIRGAKTIRELLDKHRNLTSCQGCHQLIDPPGFALESFDPIGGYRERFRSLGAGDKVEAEVDGRRVSYRLGPPVDASGQFPDGRSFKDFREFKERLLENRETFAGCLTRKLLTFATGREMGFSDRPAIEAIVKQLPPGGDGLRSLLHLIVQSETFQSK